MSTASEQGNRPSPVTCSVCGASLPDGASKCEQCGASHGQHNRCPFCRSVAEPVPHPRLRYACPACGAPRIRVQAKDFRPSDALQAHLAKARSASSSQTTWKVASAAAAAFGVLATLLLTGVIMIASPPSFAVLMAAVVTSLPFVFALLGWRNALRRSAELETELDASWLEAARTLAQTRETITASTLGEALGMDQESARHIASRLAASSEVSTDVTDSGELALSIRSPGRVRVAAAADASADPVELEAHSRDDRDQKAEA
jgi:hypothetical protein